MITVKDEIETFIPAQKPRLVILGTMVSAIARAFDGKKPEDVFFYHDRRNHFWKIMQMVFNPHIKPKQLTTKEKKIFLSEQRIAVANLVYELEVEESESKSSLDTILFKAQKNGHLKFKQISKEFRIILETTPLFFTCKDKNEIKSLIEGYFKLNKIDISVVKNIQFLPSPTRCNAQNRSATWKKIIGKL